MFLRLCPLDGLFKHAVVVSTQVPLLPYAYDVIHNACILQTMPEHTEASSQIDKNARQKRRE